MSRTIRYLATAFLLIAGLAPSAKGATVDDWRNDLEAMVRDVRGIHPDPFVRTGRLEFMREAEALRIDLPRLSEEQRVVRAMQLIASIGDTHTQLEPARPDFAIWFPIRVYEFSDGYFVTGAHRSVADLAGAQVLEAGGRPIDQVMKDVRSLMGADNEFSAMENVFPFSDAALMKGLGYTTPAGELRIKCRLRSGEIVERTLSPHRTDDTRFPKDDSSFEWHFQAEMGGPPFGGTDNWISVYNGTPYAAFRTTDESRPLRMMNRRFCATRSLPAQSAYYIQENFIGEELEDDFARALEEVDRLRPRRLIIDFRYNFGGDGDHVPAMLREFLKRSSAPPWKELYLLTGRRTLSAGIMAVEAIAQNIDHTFVGEPMAAPVNSYGDARDIPYEHTGLVLSLSTAFNKLGSTMDIRPFDSVDVPAPFSFADYAAGRDPAVDPILRGDEMRSITAIALSDGGAAARKTWESRKVSFSKYSWWSPPSEIDLRHAGQILVKEKRFADAIETARLNSEIHPDVWNVWYNLGKAQSAAGLDKEALASYRRVLEIDPNNDNGPEIRRLFAEAGQPMQ